NGAENGVGSKTSLRGEKEANMIHTISPALSAVATSIRPEDLLLKENSWVKFTDKWPDSHKWARGKVFRVTDTVLVPAPFSYILPGDDYKKIDLSNADSGLKLYPEDELVLYEDALGMKPGDYIVHFYIPTGRYVYHLADPTQIPDVTTEAYRYLGARTWRDSPWTCPLMKLYSIKDMAAFILYLYVLKGVDFEKVTIIHNINKCKLEEIEHPTPEQRERAQTITATPQPKNSSTLPPM
ncbi:MAG: hypothetical protein JRD89_10170, partial [Deltaproteobacteria bacterium]|nr:hypothetical protein [Deltaproteobacteria bacterium]